MDKSNQKEKLYLAAGILYLIIIIAGGFSEGFVRSSLKNALTADQTIK